MIERLRPWLELSRVQSVPVTASTLLIGYVTVNGGLSSEVLPLILIGIISHLTFYGIMNDVFDSWYDKRMDPLKPIPSGDIKRDKAISILISGCIITIVISYQFLDFITFTVFMSAACVGSLYNLFSKDSPYTTFLMPLWVILIVYTGGLYAGSPNIETLITSVYIASVVFVLTVMGDLKDMSPMESSIPKSLGVRVYTEDYNKKIMYGSGFSYAVIVPEIITISSSMFYFDGVSILLTIFITLSFIRTYYATSITSMYYYSRSKIMRNMVKYAVSSVIVLSFPFIIIYGAFNMMFIFSASIAWGLTMNTVLYGSPFNYS